jgi:hypothetical protein
MPRRAKKKSEQKEASSQATPPPESEEDRLIRVGMAMWFARDMEGDVPKREDVEWAIELGSHYDVRSLPHDLRRHYVELGKQDPRPFMERIKQSCQKLLELCQSHEEEKRLLERMQSSLSDLELVLAMRRYGGRPKGTRSKVSADEIENIRKWKGGDRTWVGGSSVADVAKELNVSRQTVYTILDEIKAEGTHKPE